MGLKIKAISFMVLGLVASLSLAENLDSPEDVYFAYIEEIKNTNSLDSLLPFYSSQALERLNEALNKGLSKQVILDSLKKNLEINPKLISKEIEDNTATLYLEGFVNGVFCKGKAILKREKGSWKIHKRLWAGR